MQVLNLFDFFLTVADHFVLQEKKLLFQLEGLPHHPHDLRLLTNVPNIKEAIQLRMHTCAHMHAHLALLMLAVVTACCEETRRGRSKFTLVLGIILRRRDTAAILQLIQHFPRPQRIVHFAVCVWLVAIVWRNHRCSAGWNMRGWKGICECCTIRFWSYFRQQPTTDWADWHGPNLLRSTRDRCHFRHLWYGCSRTDA
jgi:hypothetical protein